MKCDPLMFEINLINDLGIQKLVIDTFENKVPDYFWTLPASSSGKYHPLDKNGNPESLVNHTKSVTRMLLTLINHPFVKNEFDSHEKDLMIASALLHDSVKYGYPVQEKHTTHIHPMMVVKLYPYGEFIPEFRNDFIEICKIISTHHGPWITSKKSEVVLPKVESKMQYYLHMADFLASRRYIHVDEEDSNEIKDLLIK